MEPNQVYPSDLTDAQWAVLAPLVPPPTPGGRPRRLDMRWVLNAIFYIDRTGRQWRYLPMKYPNWQTVYWYFTRWQTMAAGNASPTRSGARCAAHWGATPTPAPASSTASR